VNLVGVLQVAVHLVHKRTGLLLAGVALDGSDKT